MQCETAQRELVREDVWTPDRYRQYIFDLAMREAGRAELRHALYAMIGVVLGSPERMRNLQAGQRAALDWLSYLAERRDHYHVGGPLEWPVVAESCVSDLTYAVIVHNPGSGGHMIQDESMVEYTVPPAVELPLDPVEVAPGRVKFTVMPLELAVAMGLLNASVLESDDDVAEEG